jgi:LmbE family N-acetylglucosaminyl deacetylase/glycosyltransferase involved in cell wall biosynthesis
MQEKSIIPYKAHKTVTQGKTLVFAPHPDDEIFGCGGAIINHVQQKDELKVIIVTGGGLPVIKEQKTHDYTQIRKEESRKAASILGYGEPVFLCYPDGGLIYNEKTILHLLEIVTQFQPQNIYLPASSEIHPDHITLSKIITEVARQYNAITNLFYYEIGQMQTANILLDITNVHNQLMRAMVCFQSQLEAQNYLYHINSLHAYRTYTLDKNVKYAEAYQLVNSKTIKTSNQLWKQSCNVNTVLKKDILSTNEYPIISVIVRTMHRPELSDALNSLSKQTYPNVEIIVVDALGTGELDLSNHCGSFPLRVISANIPLPRPAAANTGLAEVKGEYFCFLDEDDILFPEHILSLFGILKNSKSPAAYSNIKRVDAKNELLNIYDRDFNFHKLLWENFIPIHALLFRTKIVIENCFFDTRLNLFEDWDFLIQTCTLGDLIHSDIITGIYRDTNSSGVQGEEKANKYRIIIYKKWLERLSGKQHLEFLNYLTSLNQKKIEENKKIHIKQYLIYEEAQDKIRLLEKEKQILVHKEEVIRKIKKENERLKKLLTICNYELTSITKSLSWQLTKPLRIISLSNLRAVLAHNNNKRLIRKSELFNEVYYLQNNPDVRQEGLNPLEHFILHGGYEGRNPSPDFDSTFYMSQYPDVADSQMNPLLHYLLFGIKEGRICRKDEGLKKINWIK